MLCAVRGLKDDAFYIPLLDRSLILLFLFLGHVNHLSTLIGFCFFSVGSDLLFPAQIEAKFIDIN